MGNKFKIGDTVIGNSFSSKKISWKGIKCLVIDVLSRHSEIQIRPYDDVFNVPNEEGAFWVNSSEFDLYIKSDGPPEGLRSLIDTNLKLDRVIRLLIKVSKSIAKIENLKT